MNSRLLTRSCNFVSCVLFFVSFGLVVQRHRELSGLGGDRHPRSGEPRPEHLPVQAAGQRSGLRLHGGERLRNGAQGKVGSYRLQGTLHVCHT